MLRKHYTVIGLHAGEVKGESRTVNGHCTLAFGMFTTNIHYLRGSLKYTQLREGLMYLEQRSLDE